ncbi:MAG: hypothetical protein Q8M31_19990 [Beijerinckiaceae bacterium]|nr:hypothetical protein [Beijerinckiaceae bacterium]
MKIAFLTCHDLLEGAPERRADAFEHDLQIGALRSAMAGAQSTVIEIDWRSPLETFDDFDVALLGTAWDYQDHALAFLARLDEISSRGVDVCNRPQVARWNIDKSYLRALELTGVATIPTLWHDDPGAADLNAAFDLFACERVVVKRRVGAGAVGQFDFTRNAPPQAAWRLGCAGLIQPFLPSIATEGEYSLIFIDGEFSHALVKRPADGDYRIQSLYGGVETAVTPSAIDLRSARSVLDALPFTDLLYARIDMVRGFDGKLCLMEAELIEPYLYPLQGRDVGVRLAKAIQKRCR